MERHFSTGQSPQWSVVPMDEEEEDNVALTVQIRLKSVNICAKYG